MANTPEPPAFGVYLVSFPWKDKAGPAPANYPDGYRYWLNFDDAGIAAGAWHRDGNTEEDLGPDTIYADEYPNPSDRSHAYSTTIAGAASGPLLAAPLPNGCGLVRVPLRPH